MRTHAIAPLLLMALAALVGLGGIGCGKKGLKTHFLPNERPTVRLTAAPVDTTSEYFYVYRLNWIGHDPDGRVDHFEYAVDPPTKAGVDTPWVQTRKNEQIITFSAPKPESLPDKINKTRTPRGQGFHVFVIRAVDNQNLYSAPVARAFFSYGMAPVVMIDAPKPSSLLFARVTPAVRIKWSGKDFIDPNGNLFEKPVKYKYALFKKGAGIPWTTWISDPDSMRRTFAPEFAGWDSTGPDSAEVQYTNLTPSSEYLFVVVAFARSGAYSPIFDLNSNMLLMSVGFAGFLGPQIAMYNSFFAFIYPSGGFPSPLDPTWAVQLQVPASQPLTFNWFAIAPEGSDMRRYRWVLDLVNLDDETARESQKDWYHWSPWNLSVTSATVGPFAGAGGDTGETHNFYIEAEDINGLVSLGWIQFRVFKPDTSRDLLIVNDTRYNTDQISRVQPPGRTDSLQAPTGVWPTRAELDTFLFAAGGVRWKMTPPGRLSEPGIFNGYPYDTLGTRHGQENPTVPLSFLGHYRHVVWMVDGYGSLFQPGEVGCGPTCPTEPMTTLRYMCNPNRQNTLATWVGEGGQLWVLGGGCANATLGPWNNKNNDTEGRRIYSSVGSRPDLTAGRFMYDLAHWRSELRPIGPINNVSISRLDQPDPTQGYPPDPRAWPGGDSLIKRWNPAWATLLPTALLPKDPATDPIWPYRSYNDFYVNSQYSQNGIYVEFISLENRITEDTRPDPKKPDSVVEVSTLDTLYLTYAPGYGNKFLQVGEGVNGLMTVYRGSDTQNLPLVFTGTDIWHFRRDQCVSLVDFVLGELWYLRRTRLYARAQAPPAFTRPAATPFQRPFQRPLGGPARKPTAVPTFLRLR